MKKNIKVVAEAVTDGDLFNQIKNHEVDILLSDITLPGGLNGYEVAKAIRKDLPDIKLLILSMSEEGRMIAKMIDEANVDGYIPKSFGRQELFDAIETIANGGKYFAETVLKQYERYCLTKNENEKFHLTTRELQIIHYIMKHYSNKQIANSLFISERTVETHRKNIYHKTGTKGEASLIQFVQAHQLI